MLLAIDCGNTNVLFALIRGEEILARWRISTDRHRTADEYAVWLTQLMALKSLTSKNVSGVIIASVVPEAVRDLRLLSRQYFGQDALVVGNGSGQVRPDIPILLDRPEEVGADRIVNALAARHYHSSPSIIVDFGTATTFDYVDQEGQYAGGVIAPGINLSLEALYMAAAKLPRIAIRRPLHILGKSTIQAMESGVFWGYIGLIEGMVDRLQKEQGSGPHHARMKIVATGGLANLFGEATSIFDAIDGDLTLRGLSLIYRAQQA